MTLGRPLSLFACALFAAGCSAADNNSTHRSLRDAGGDDAEVESDADIAPAPGDEDGGAETPETDAEVEPLDASGPAADAAPDDAGTGPVVDAGADAGNDAAVSAGVLKSRCGAPSNLDNAVRIAAFPIMRSRPNGNIAVTWQELDTPAATYRDVVRAFVGGSLGAQHVLSENAASRAEAAIDDLGNLHVHWADPPIGLDREREDYNAASAQWSGKAQWFTNRGSEITLPLRMFALNHTGLTLHTTFYNLNGSGTAAAAVFDPGSSQWGALLPLEASSNNISVGIPSAAINDAGQGAVFWHYTDNTTGQNLSSFHASTLSGGSFSAPVSVAGGNEFFDVVMLSGGDVVLAYANTDRVSARRFSPSAAPGSQWSEAQTVDMRQPGTPTLVVDAMDRVTAVWAAGQTVRAARYEAGAWQPAADLGFTDLGFQVAVDVVGNVSVVYGANSAPIKLRRLAAAGGSWTDAINAASEVGTIQSPMVAHDAAGNVVVAYSLNRPLPQGGSEGHIRWLVCE